MANPGQVIAALLAGLSKPVYRGSVGLRQRAIYRPPLRTESLIPLEPSAGHE